MACANHLWPMFSFFCLFFFFFFFFFSLNKLLPVSVTWILKHFYVIFIGFCKVSLSIKAKNKTFANYGV